VIWTLYNTCLNCLIFCDFGFINLSTCYLASPFFVYFHIRLTTTNVNIPKQYQKQQFYDINLRMINIVLVIVVFPWDPINVFDKYERLTTKTRQQLGVYSLGIKYRVYMTFIVITLYFNILTISRNTHAENTMTYFASWTRTWWKHAEWYSNINLKIWN